MLIHWDERRDLIIPGSASETITFAANHWLDLAKQAISQSGRFAVALSGGSTPKAIFEKLSMEPNTLDWKKVWLFWSDERSVPPDHLDSNYHMAMTAGFQKLPLDPTHIFRMKAETEIERHALEYEDFIKKKLGNKLFDLVMLGLGEDGHTASLFPHTSALNETKRLVVANPVPPKNTTRMTFTFPCINQSAHIALYALGASKQAIVKEVLTSLALPASLIGTPDHPATWILDQPAAALLPDK